MMTTIRINYLYPLFIFCIFFLTNNLAYADCDSSDNDAALAACLAAQLWETDQKINLIYQDLMGKFQKEDQIKLRNEQRSWLKMRDTVCGLDNRKSNREKWIHNIARDYQKTICVVRFTQKRIHQLETYQANINKKNKPNIAAEAISKDGGVYEVSAGATRSQGKWYFEVKLNPGEIAKEMEIAFYMGFEGRPTNMGKLVYIRKTDQGRSVYNFGFALDLDNGKFYRSQNGNWFALPGSAGGSDIKLGRDYRAKVTSSSSMHELLKRKLVDVNFGQRPFEYALPNGYRPFIEK